MVKRLMSSYDGQTTKKKMRGCRRLQWKTLLIYLGKWRGNLVFLEKRATKYSLSLMMTCVCSMNFVLVQLSNWSLQVVGIIIVFQFLQIYDRLSNIKWRNHKTRIEATVLWNNNSMPSNSSRVAKNNSKNVPYPLIRAPITQKIRTQ